MGDEPRPDPGARTSPALLGYSGLFGPRIQAQRYITTSTRCGPARYEGYASLVYSSTQAGGACIGLWRYHGAPQYSTIASAYVAALMAPASIIDH